VCVIWIRQFICIEQINDSFRLAQPELLLLFFSSNRNIINHTYACGIMEQHKYVVCECEFSSEINK